MQRKVSRSPILMDLGPFGRSSISHQGEIQSKKQQSILPCVVSENACAFLSVLHFLKPHRVHVERKRQDAHSIYMRIGSSTGQWYGFRCNSSSEVHKSMCFSSEVMQGWSSGVFLYRICMCVCVCSVFG